MSKLIMFNVYDSKAMVYDKPFCMMSKGECIRGFIDALKRTDTTLGQHPGDFTLFEVGEYDQKTGTVSMLNAKINLGNGLEFKETKL